MTASRNRWLVVAAGIVAALLLLAASIASKSDNPTVPAELILGALAVSVAIRYAASWQRLIILAGVADLLVPSDGRYTIGGGLPVKLEPYRVVVGLMLVGWVLGLLVDPKVRARGSRFDRPIGLVLLATIGSELFNTGRFVAVESYAVKGLSVFFAFIALFYMTVSVVRTREAVERILKWCVLAGCVEALAALVQRANGFNIFDHLHGVIPIFTFNPGVELDNLLRGGHLRALASAGHPIELSNAMAILMPVAAFLAIKYGRRWWLAVVVLLFGCLSSGSKTGMVEIGVMVVVIASVEPKAVMRASPAVIPLLVVVGIAAPGAIQSIVNGFFPKGGFIAQQSQTFRSGHGQVIYATRLSRIAPEINGVFLQHNLLFGEGAGTRVVGRTTADNAQVLDDQWLGTLLETGIIGVVAWIWLFTRSVRLLRNRAKLERGSPDRWLPLALAASIAGYAISMATYDAFGFIQATFLLYLFLAFGSVVLETAPKRGSDANRYGDRFAAPVGAS